MIKRNKKGQFVKGVTVGEYSPRWKGAKGNYRLIIEKHLGRKLRPEEVVHHINGNRKDNRIENLVLFKNKAEHSKFHLKKYKEVKSLPKATKLGEILAKRDKSGQSRKYQTRKCIICNDLFWASFYGKNNKCGKRHYYDGKTKKYYLHKRFKKICKYCENAFNTHTIKSKFCSHLCYGKFLKINPSPSSFKKGHKPYNYWLGKKRSEETKSKISKTKKERCKNGFYK